VIVSQLEALDDTDLKDIQELSRAATAADGSAPLGEHVMLRLRGPGPHLVARDGGRLVGYAQLDPTDAPRCTAELAVHPDARRRGIGRELVRALLAATGAGVDARSAGASLGADARSAGASLGADARSAGASLGADARSAGASLGASLQVWAHGELPGAVALAAELGFRQVRTLWQMRRGLVEPPLPPVTLPAGVRLRSFRLGADDAEFLRVNNAAFDWHPEQGGWGPEQLYERAAEPWFDPAGFLLAVDTESSSDGRLLGYHWTKQHSEPEQIGEVYVVGVDPAEQGRKLGAALTLAGLHYLRDRRLPSVLLYVEADNLPAVRVYQKLGFTRWHTDAAFIRP
jgi:mycothiol synthase